MPSDDKSSHCLWQGELKMQDNICSTQPRILGKRTSQKYTPNSCHETNIYSDDDTNRQNMNQL